MVAARGVVFLLVAVGMTACATRPRPRPQPRENVSPSQAVVAPDPAIRIVALIDAARAGTPSAWDEAAVQLTESEISPEAGERAVRAAAGHEERLFEALLSRARFLDRDVSALLQRVGRAVGESGRWTAWRAAVREVSGRECCMTRKFLSSALHGLADGLEAAQVPVQAEAETALRLQELSDHPDPEVAAASRRVREHFRTTP